MTKTKVKITVSAFCILLFAACLCALFTLGIASVKGMAASAPSAYDGVPVTPTVITEENYRHFGLNDVEWVRYYGYYGIRNAKELYGFAELVHNRNIDNEAFNAVLLQDIVINTTVSASGAAYTWTPIGGYHNSRLRYYTGTFDGNGHTISGLYVNNTANNTDGENVGLFGYVGYESNAATIKNLTLANSYIRGNMDVGGIAGQVNSSNGTLIVNCNIAETVSISAVNAYVGGIVGFAYTPLLSGTTTTNEIRSCTVYGNVKSENQIGYIGAIVGCYEVTENAKKHINVTDCYYLKDCAKDAANTSKKGKGGIVTTQTVTNSTESDDGCTVLSSLNAEHTCVLAEILQCNGTCLYGGHSAYSYCVICGNKTGYQAYAENEALHAREVRYTTGSATHQAHYDCCDTVKAAEDHTWVNKACEVCHYECRHDTVVDGVCLCGSVGVPYIKPLWDSTKGALAVSTEFSAATFKKVTDTTSDIYNGWYIVEGNVNVSGHINISGEVNLLLANNSSLTVETYLMMNSGARLNIYVQSDDPAKMGALTVKGDEDYGFRMEENSALTVNGGKLSVLKGGIIVYGNNVSVTVNSGTVSVQRVIETSYAAAIGTTFNSSYTNTTVTVNGGTLTAIGGTNAAAIGGGLYEEGITVVITGGSVNAIPGNDEIDGIGPGLYGEGGSLKNAVGSNLLLYTYTVNGATAGTAVTAIEGLNTYYGLYGATVLEGGKLYFYLPEGEKITALTAGGVEYICTEDDLSFFAAHDWSYADGVCARCGEACEHERLTASVCDLCGTVFHTHEWHYRADGSTITATCEGTVGECSVAGKTVTVTLNSPEDPIYNGTVKAVTVTQTPAGVFTDLPAVTYTGNRTDAGEHIASLTYGGVTATLTFAVEKATPTVTPPTANEGLVYSGTEKALVSAGSTTGGTLVYKVNDGDWSALCETGINAGTYTVYYKVNGDENYNGTAVQSVTVTIGQATSSIAFTPAYNPGKVYNDNPLIDPPAPYLIITGAAYTDVVFTWYKDSVDEANKLSENPKDAGIYYVVASIPKTSNITASTATSREITISPMVADNITITFAQDSFVYDGTPKTPVVSVRYEGYEISASEYTVSHSNNTDAGTATVTITDKEGGNFTVNGSKAFEITRASLTVTADSKSVCIENALPALTYTVEGLVDGETLLVPPTLTTDAVMGTTGDYGITVGGAQASGNYTVTYVDGTLTVRDHAYHGAVTTTPSCIAGGEMTYTCSYDSTHTYTDPLPIDANAHAWDEGVVTADPTCTAGGTRTYTCTHNGAHTKTEGIDALGHTEQTVAGKAASCTENGLSDGVKCAVCGEILAAQTVITASGHTYDNACDGDCNTCGSTRTPAEHSDENEDRTCDVCGKELPKDGLSGGAIAGIATGSTATAGLGGFALFWFVIKKKKWSDLVGIFKK